MTSKYYNCIEHKFACSYSKLQIVRKLQFDEFKLKKKMTSHMTKKFQSVILKYKNQKTINIAKGCKQKIYKLLFSKAKIHMFNFFFIRIFSNFLIQSSYSKGGEISLKMITTIEPVNA